MFKQFIEDFSLKNRVLKDVYLCIKQYGPISKAELLEKTKLKQTTLARMIEEMMTKKMIRESGIGESAGGRPPVLYHIISDCCYIIGVYINRLKADVVLFDLLLNEADHTSFIMTSKHTPDFVISEIIQSINVFMDKYHFSDNQLLGIGIAMIGPIDKKRGIILKQEYFPAPGWADVPIIEKMKETFSVRVVLENSSNSAVLSEYKHPSCTFENVLYIFTGGWGLACGVVSSGELIQNITGDVHLIVDVDGRMCLCGKKGCLLSYATLYGILKELNHQYASVEWPLENLGEVQNVIQFLKDHKHFADGIIKESAYYLGVALANMVNLFQSEFVILNGPMIHGYPDFYEKVVASTKEYINTRHEVHFNKGGVLKNNAATVGAAISVFDSYFELQ